jgi:methylenetetrahydrofolate dehydrogenase (NADP+)/methenyltetrahydrofolate cyclohydrolase
MKAEMGGPVAADVRVPARLIDGAGFAARLRTRLAMRVTAFRVEHGREPGLAVVLVGDDPASRVYVRNKVKHAREVGIASHEYKLAADTPQDALMTLIGELNADSAVDGILVQLPLPEHLDAQLVVRAIDPAKDVDGLHVVNAGELLAGRDAMLPCTPLGCMMLLRHTLGTNLAGREAVVLGRSALVGKPMAMLLLGADCTVTVAHSRTRDLLALCRRAEILVAAVGRPEMVRGDWIRPGATVIDVGINRVERGGESRLVGDVAFAEARSIAGAITPVPGGVGPMTVACLLANTVKAFCRRRDIPVPPEARLGDD